jgi:hypothetical protein
VNPSPPKRARERVNATSKETLCISTTFASALFGYSGVTREHDVIMDRGEVRKRKKGRPSSLPMSLDTQFLPPRGRGYDNAHHLSNTRCSFA